MIGRLPVSTGRVLTCLVHLALFAAVLSAANIVLTTLAASLFLANQGADAVPLFYVLLAAVSIPLASVLSVCVDRFARVRLFQTMMAVCLALIIVLRMLLAVDVAATYYAVYIFAYALEILMDILFWILVADYLTTIDLKRHATVLAMAFAAGGIVGGAVTALLTGWFGLSDLLLVLPLLFAVAIVQLELIARFLAPLPEGADPAADGDENDPGLREALRGLPDLFKNQPLVPLLCLGIFLMSALFCLQDYLALRVYAGAYPDEEALASFLALIYAALQFAELVLLLVVGGSILGRSGPLVRNLVFPITSLIGLGALMIWNTLPAAIFLHINANAVSNAIFEPVKTLNYCAIPHRLVGQVRMLADGICYPLGIVAGGLGVLLLQDRLSDRAMTAVGIGGVLVFLAVGILIGRRFLPSMLDTLDTDGRSLDEIARTLRRAVVRHEPLGFGPLGFGPLGFGPLGFGTTIGRSSAGLPSIPTPHHRPTGRRDQGVPIRILKRLRHHFLRLRFLTARHRRIERLALVLSTDARPASRRRGMELCASAATPPAIRQLGLGLEDDDATVREAAVIGLTTLTRHGAVVAASRLGSPRREVVDAAIRVLAGVGSPRARRLLLDFLRPLYEQAAMNRRLATRLVRSGGQSWRILDLAIQDSNRRIIGDIMRVKAAMGNPRLVRRLHGLSLSPDPRARANAIEALTCLRSRRFLVPVIPLMNDVASPAFDADHASCSVAIPDSGAEPARDNRHLLRAAAETRDKWIRMAVRHHLAILAGQAAAGPTKVAAPVKACSAARPASGVWFATKEGSDMDRILFLKTVELFKSLTLDEILALSTLFDRVDRPVGEIVVREGAPGRYLFLVQTGLLDLRLGSATVGRLASGAHFGDAALFDDGVQPVTVAVVEEATLLRLPRAAFRSLLDDHPAVVGELYRAANSTLAEVRARLAIRPPTDVGEVDPGPEKRRPEVRG